MQSADVRLIVVKTKSGGHMEEEKLILMGNMRKKAKAIIMANNIMKNRSKLTKFKSEAANGQK